MLTEEELLLTYQPWPELMPHGLAALVSCKCSLAEPASEAAIVGLLRLLDVDMSGGISAADLTACLVHGTPSSWMTGAARRSTGSFRRQVARALRLTSSTSSTSSGKTVPVSPKTVAKAAK